jgi:hypothetical protein
MPLSNVPATGRALNRTGGVPGCFGSPSPEQVRIVVPYSPPSPVAGEWMSDCLMTVLFCVLVVGSSMKSRGKPFF